MTKIIHPHRVAGAAIAAVLAFGSTPLFAQDIVLDVPPPAPAAAPVAQPTIVLPTVTAAPAEPAPVAAPAPAAEPVVAAPQREVTPPRAAAPRAATPSRTAVAPTVTPAAPAIAPVADSPAAPVAAADPIVAEPVAPAAETNAVTPADTSADAAPADNATSDLLPIVGILAALGLGGLAIFATRRRRRDLDEVEPVIVAHEPVPVRPAAVAAPAPLAAAATAATAAAQPAPVRLQQSVQQSRPMWQEPRRAAASATTQQSFDNRQALLDRMVAAAPDANNPFTSGKARRRRARLMLQSMDNQRWDDAQLEPGFDWREQARATRERETVKA